MTTNRLMGVGAFVLLGLTLFGAGLFMIGDRRMLFSRKFEVYTEFSKLAGLESGGPVWVSGMRAGEIAGIELPGEPAKFRLRLKIRRDLKPLLRADSVATIKTEGLVGNTILELSAGSTGAPEIEVDGTIPSREPITFGDMVQQIGETVQAVGDTVQSVRGDLQIAVKSMAGAAERAGSVVGDIGKAASNMSENAEALKHNFFFKGFFKDRGYFDLESISPIDYRRGALMTKGRVVVRTWLPGNALFRRAGASGETLSPEGRSRLDAALGEWMQFRGEGPLMVEGYSTAPTSHAQYLASRARASQVRTYLLERFTLDPKSTGFIALGSEAQGSPQGNTFDGIALALYVDKKTLDEARKPRGAGNR
jgi:hypothetical protein